MEIKKACLMFTLMFVPICGLADIHQVRVLNDTKENIYIHQGGFAPSVKILPNKWKVFTYPFKATPPNSDKEITTSLLVASSGGRWTTTPNGFTYLANPNMVICIDYRSPEHKDKSGNRLWTIQRSTGVDKNCNVKGYKQPWFSEDNSQTS